MPSREETRNLLRALPTIYLLHPNPEYWPKDEAIVTVGSKEYSANDI